MVLYHPFGILPASSPINLFYFDIWMKVYINWLLFIDKLICVWPVTVAEKHCNCNDVLLKLVVYCFFLTFDVSFPPQKALPLVRSLL